MAKPGRKRGRKSLYKPQIVEELLKVLRSGCTQQDAFTYVGIASSTYWDWMTKRPEFAAAVEQAKAKARVGVVNHLVEQIKKGSAAATIFWLKNRDPDHWQDSPEPTASGNTINIFFNVPRPKHQIIESSAVPQPQLPRPTHGVSMVEAKK